MAAKAPRLVLAGAGHAHLTALWRLRALTDRGIDVTVVAPGPWLYYSGMGPGMLAGTYAPDEIRFPVRQLALAGGARFIEGTVLRIDAGRRMVHLADGGEVPYTVLSVNLGSRTPSLPVTAGHLPVFAVKPIENLVAARAALRALIARDRLRAVVVGGGPAGVETAAALWRMARNANATADITLASGGELLARYPQAARDAARQSLQARGVTVLEHRPVAEVTGAGLVFADGAFLPAQVCLNATGVTPPPVFRHSGLATAPDGALLVNEFLQSSEHPGIFGGGDCVAFLPRPLERVGVYAVRQNPVLFANCRAALEGWRLRPFKPQRHYLAIMNLADGTGLAVRGGAVFHGRLAFLLKHYLDRSFMHRFTPRQPRRSRRVAER